MLVDRMTPISNGPSAAGGLALGAGILCQTLSLVIEQVVVILALVAGGRSGGAVFAASIAGRAPPVRISPVCGINELSFGSTSRIHTLFAVVIAPVGVLLPLVERMGASRARIVVFISTGQAKSMAEVAYISIPHI